MGYSVKWVDEHLGITRDMLRYYEKEKLLPVAETRNPTNKYSDYSEEDANYYDGDTSETGEEYLEDDGSYDEAGLKDGSDDLEGDDAYYEDGAYTDDGEYLDESTDGEEETAGAGEE